MDTAIELLNCPRCGRDRMDPVRYATSRRDNRTHICAECGTEEAMFDWLNATGYSVSEEWANRERRFRIRITR